MSMLSWVGYLKSGFHSHQTGRAGSSVSRGRRFGRKLFLEILEDRTLLSVLTVNNTNDDTNFGSLRWAIATASNGDTIMFDPGLQGQTITLTRGQLLITTSLTIQGPGPAPKMDRVMQKAHRQGKAVARRFAEPRFCEPPLTRPLNTASDRSLPGPPW